MTDQEILEGIHKETPVSVPYFDNKKVPITIGQGFPENEILSVTKTFLSLTSTDRLNDSRHVFAYYQDIYNAVSGADWMDKKFGKIITAEDVWKHVQPVDLTLFKRSAVIDVPNTSNDLYTLLEAHCD